MLLRYQNLTIRDAVVQDAGQLAQWWNDGRVMAHAGFPNGTGETVQEIAETIKNCDTSHRLLMIEMDDIAIGEMSVRWKADATAAIGIKLCDASRQNKGIGKVLLSMLISSLFHDALLTLTGKQRDVLTQGLLPLMATQRCAQNRCGAGGQRL